MGLTGPFHEGVADDGGGDHRRVGDGLGNGAHDVQVPGLGDDAAAGGAPDGGLQPHDAVPVRGIDHLRNFCQGTALKVEPGRWTHAPVRLSREPKRAHGRRDGHGAPAAGAAGVLRQVVRVPTLAPPAGIRLGATEPELSMFTVGRRGSWGVVLV